MTKLNDVTDLANVDGVAVITIDSPPVNALSFDVRTGIKEAVDKSLADSDIKALVLICGGRTFIAGADISEIGTEPGGPGLHELIDLVEAADKPVIAAIHGTALGGGLELALACHYRVAVPSAKCGLPEVKLGLLPGAGGTQRLPRLIGVERALNMIVFSEHVPAEELAQLGLIDELVPDGELREGAIAFARCVVDEGRPLRKVSEFDEKVIAARDNPGIFDEFRKANARKLRGFEAPEYAIRAIEGAVKLPFREGLRNEWRLFDELAAGNQAAAQRHVFFAERQVWKIPGLPDDLPLIPIDKVGIIGAGTMGGGIAMNFASAGIPVTIVETRQEALDRGLATIRRNYENSARRGRIKPEDVDTRMALISASLQMEDLADVDLVIEAVFENMALKKEIFTKLDSIVKQGAILATNTSALDINEIAAVTSRPEAVIGLHFFSPANVMRLLEVVRGDKTSDAVIATSMKTARRIGKIAVLVGVCPGFVGNRILAPRQREAHKLMMEGAMPWNIDRVLYDFGFPMGPFAMQDLAGLDIGWLRESSKGVTIRDRLCEMDRRGQKTGAGYYDYDDQRNRTPSPVVEKIVLDYTREKGIERRAITDDEILERCIYPMINEGAKILEEGKALRSSDIDVVWLNGYGWPAYRGGPMFYADAIGLDKVLDTMRNLEAAKGPEFKPAKLLEELAVSGRKFRDL